MSMKEDCTRVCYANRCVRSNCAAYVGRKRYDGGYHLADAVQIADEARRELLPACRWI